MRRIAILLSSLLVISILPAIAATPPKAGTSCAKLGITKNSNGKTFTCIKSGKKLVWNKGIAIKKAAPQVTPSAIPSPSPTASASIPPNPTATSAPSTTPIPTPSQTPSMNAGSSTRVKQKTSLVSYESPSTPSENVDLCKIKQSGNDGTKSGFPAPTPLYQGKGVVTWALIPLDFSDLPGEANYMTRAQEQMDFASEWADNSSEGQLKIQWKVHDQWVRMPGLSTDYAIPVSDNKGFASTAQQSVWTKAITEADKYFNFTGIQGVQFILPKGQKIIEYGIKGNNSFDVVKNYVTGEGTRIDLFSIPSTFNEEPNSNRNFWSWWMYHYMVGIGVGKFGGSKIATPFHTYLIHGSTEGARELGGWIRFLVGWMPESRVYCRTVANLTSVDITLIPLTDNETKGTKLMVIPLSEKKALVLESRRETKFACLTNTERNGVLAYVYDSNLGHLDEYFTPLAPNERPVESFSCYASPGMDYLLHEGDKITYEGITVELLAHGKFDKLKVSRNP